ncbi:LysM peptidoglycan-binding domain-containing protein [Clostridium sp. C105KSO13]|uniref:LysM peptidoglycan-binding domain-containing protein n=1 Tax=Clostridium sp. C105KSO13 TaxID=1776045 RepID=UPI0007406316|nr:LysM peptidoglycan-binding domain-containing protein [Clostridium sp. C105KSO13]CUX50669.1 Cell division suppressor protein YneA [Clostridium sp. C105KSO13]
MGSRGSNSNAATQKEATKLRRLIIILVVTVFIVFGVCTLFGGILSSAHDSRKEEPVNFNYYKSIVIQPGDTLWDIARTYITEDYTSIPDYVQALKEINSLSSDHIQAGQNLMVAYDSSEFIVK